MQLVYLAPVPWESFAQRPHKFVKWFHSRTGRSVLWIDPYPTRLPNLRDFRRLSSSAADGQGQSTSTPQWLTVLKSGGIPLEPIPGSGLINGRLWSRHLRYVEKFSRNAGTLLAVGKPSALALKLLQRLNHCPSLYDAMDDFPAFYSGISRFALARRELKIARRVGALWVSSSQLAERWGSVRGDLCLVHNGLDLDSVGQVATATQRSSKNKIFGYVGTIASWFDWEWVCALAMARPNDEIQLIGPVFQQPVGKLPPNIRLLPACEHSAALRSMMQFDVGIIPFKKSVLTDSVDPIKYYEYRAIGLPVIATNFGEMRKRSNACGVFITQSANDLPAMAKSALQFRNDATESVQFARHNTWEARFDATKLLSP